MIRFRCPHCKKAITGKETLAGRKARCPGCGGTLVVPSNEPKWYFTVGGRRLGPVEKPVLVRLAAGKKLKITDKVWSKHLGDRWVDAGRVPGLFAVSQTVVPRRSPSVSGRTPNRELMRQAREALSGRWGTAVGLCLVYMILVGVSNALPFIGWVLGFLVIAPLSLGLYSAFLNLVKRQGTSVNRLFSGFQHFGNAVGTYLGVVLMVLLWTAVPLAVETAYFGSLFLNRTLLTNPGSVVASFPVWLLLLFFMHMVLATVAGLVYSMAFFILADTPSLRPLETIKKSREKMRGYIWKLFCLECRFIGWMLLGVLSFGLGFLWIGPYLMTSLACF